MGARAHLATLLDDFRRNGRQTATVTHSGVRHFRTSYAELATLAARFGAELERRGIRKGERVLLWGENSGPWLAAFFGCLMRGVLAVPIDSAGTAEFSRRVAADVAPLLVCADAGHAAALPSGLPCLIFESLRTGLPEAQGSMIPDLKDSDPFQIIFTAGTTAEPKGIVHTHGNVLASLRPIEQEIQKYLRYERIFHPLRFLHTLPLSHVFGQFMGIWIPALLAAEVHFQSRLVALELLPAIRRPRVSVLAAVPRVLDLLRTHLLTLFPGLEARVSAAREIPVWKRWWVFRDVHAAFGFKFWAFVCGGATLPAGLESFWTTLGFAVIQGYGMTETAALVSLNHPFHQARGSVGKVLPGREIQLGQDGEILVRGDTVAGLTWQHGHLQPRDSDWLATGDLAAIDPEGNLRYRGRKKEVIVTAAGLNIFPEDVETALLRQPLVKTCTIIESEGAGGPEPVAVLVLRELLDPAAAIKAANRELAEYQQIHRWVVWPEPDLPRNSAGKVLRREVARRLAAGGDPDTLSSILRGGDLQLDSLGRVELQARLESQFGVALDDAAWAGVHTADDVRGLLRQPGAATAAPPAGEHLYPTWPWSPVLQLVRAIFQEALIRPLVWLLAKPSVQSELRQLPSTRMLIVANHVTAYDVPLVLYALPARVRRRVAVAMSGELLLNLRKGRGQGNRFLNCVAPIAYWLITSLFNVFPLPQKTGFRRSFDHAGRAVDAGYHILVFPEGARTRDVQMHSFQTGAGLLWKELRTAALPVYLAGLAEMKVRGSGWFHSGGLTVRVGQPVEADPSHEPRELALRLEAAVAHLARQP